jgi:hypothetical protein
MLLAVELNVFLLQMASAVWLCSHAFLGLGAICFHPLRLMLLYARMFMSSWQNPIPLRVH